MGLKNYITDGIYVAIDNIQYHKNVRVIRFDANIYKDGTKKVRIAAQTHDFAGTEKYRRISGTAKTPPPSPKNGETWIVQQDATGDWQTRDGLLAIWETGDNVWHFWHWGHNEIFKYLPNKQYCLFDEETKTILPAPINLINDIEWWDSFFAPQVIFGGTTNLWRQLYVYLKLLPGFENVIDC